jgi:raffinose-raffinose alpha-galactotransferase
MKPLVSVIIPVFNVEQYIERCVESVINQEYKNIEIILVDDGSTDQSGMLCDELATKDERIHVIHKKNGGLSSARNSGLEHASGEWVTFIDSDDWVTEDYVSGMYNTAEMSKADVVIGGVAYIR